MSTTDLIAGLDPKHGILVNGRGVGAATTFEVHDPATGTVVAEVADGSALEAGAAVTAAADAFAAWAATPPRARAEILRRAYDLVVADVDRLAALITLENGKSDADACGEVLYAAEFFRWFSEEAVRIAGGPSSRPGPWASPPWSRRGTSPRRWRRARSRRPSPQAAPWCSSRPPRHP
jgi:succinate-semialdehyde dehydrogenase / glutarate-semialdehyde dehydrogenase